MLGNCLSLARNAGIEKVELEVFSDNIAAVRLYDSFGFRQEGLKVRGRKLEDRYQDVVLMALWLWARARLSLNATNSKKPLLSESNIGAAFPGGFFRRRRPRGRQ
jgi:hypothetical protein